MKKANKQDMERRARCASDLLPQGRSGTAVTIE